jgi:LysR family nitrogen assimilation transcriptional regulator
MNVQDLLTFAVVARLESFSRASQHLHIAQSAVSRRVQRLETSLGQTLLERHPRGVRPNKAGQLLLAHAHTVQAQLTAIEMQMKALLRPHKDELRLALPYGAMRLFGSSLVEGFRTSTPSTLLHLFERESLENRQILLEGAVDLALAYDADPCAELIARPLLKERLLVVGPARKDGAPVRYPRTFSARDLARLPLVVPGPQHGYRRVIERIIRAMGIEPNIAVEVHGLSAMTELVKGGVGYAVSTFGHMKTAIEDGQVVATLISSPHCSVILSLLQRQDRQTSVPIRALRQAIESAAETLDAPQHCKVLVDRHAMPN